MFILKSVICFLNRTFKIIIYINNTYYDVMRRGFIIKRSVLNYLNNLIFIKG
jgi:hypothetical protein